MSRLHIEKVKPSKSKQALYEKGGSLPSFPLS